MATFTTKFGLRKPATSEPYDVVNEFNANMDLIDLNMGDRSSTSTTRPSVAYVGLRVYETDTRAVIVCKSIGPIVWEYVTSPKISSSAAMNVIAPVFPGLTCVRLDLGRVYVFDGVAFVDLGFPRVIEGASTSDLTLTLTTTDIAGATSGSFTLVSAAIVLIQANFDMTTTATTGGYCYGKFAIDGVTNARTAPMLAIGAGPPVDRRGGFIQSRQSLAAGSHTIKLQGSKDVNTGTVSLGGVLEVTIFG